MAEAIPDLAGIALCIVALALLLAALNLAKALRDALNVGFLGIHPFSGIASALNNTLVAWLDDAVKGTEKLTAKLFNDLTASLELLAGLSILLGDAVVKGLEYLWAHALPGVLHALIDPIGTIARAAKSLVDSLAGTVETNLHRAEAYAEAQAAKALGDAQAFVRSQVAGAVAALRGELGAAVSTLETAISTAETHTLQLAADGLAAAERTIGGEITTAEQTAAAALAASEAIGAAALAGVKSIAVTAEDDLNTIEAGLGALGLAGLIASIPALATLVHTIATEAGLDSSKCRAKNKLICGTDPLQWASLLAGLAALGVSFDLADVVKLAAEGVGEAGGLLADVARVPDDVVRSVGGVIGQVAAGIAA